MMNVKKFVAALIDAAKNHKTLYVMGCFGAPMTEAAKARYIGHHPYNARNDRQIHIRAATADTYGFDCVCLIKGILWGWCGDPGDVYGGANYASAGVPDIDADQMITVCKDVSVAGWRDIEPGELLWVPGHVGIYVGDGLAVECTPSWANGVQLTAVANIGWKSGYPGRTWQKHGRLPYVKYDAASAPAPAPAPKPAEKTIDELAEEVIAGAWGNGDERERRLTAAGYDYAAVQERVNDILAGNDKMTGQEQAAFLEKIGPMASEDMRVTGILASLTIAQAILESGWGESGLTEQANNLFGMKGAYEGESYVCKTKEWDGEKYVETEAAFRKYPSWEESVADHSRLFLEADRYENLRGLTDHTLACRYVQEDGYATAPDYAEALIQLIEEHELTRWDVKLAEKTIDELAEEVIAGAWGNGDEREQRLTAAGYDYAAVQDRVNDMLRPEPETYTVKPGDSLWAIAADKLHDGTRWMEIQKLNGLDGTLIHPGDVLKLPN